MKRYLPFFIVSTIRTLGNVKDCMQKNVKENLGEEMSLRGTSRINIKAMFSESVMEDRIWRTENELRDTN